MDEDTLVVAYREWRGEPRGKIAKGEETKSSGGTKGDCIDCLACVNVCPMGIDIRDGQQLECITCALCIDACNDVMDKIGKPRGLIDYMALRDETAERAGGAPKSPLRHIFRIRTMIYFVLWAAIGVALVVALFMRSDFDLNVTPQRNPLFVTMSDGGIRNVYEVRLRNKQAQAHQFRLDFTDEDGVHPEQVEITIEGETENKVDVAADSTATRRVYLTAARGSSLASTDKTKMIVWIEEIDGTGRAYAKTVFHGKQE